MENKLFIDRLFEEDNENNKYTNSYDISTKSIVAYIDCNDKYIVAKR
jgi:hypothetical protein